MADAENLTPNSAPVAPPVTAAEPVSATPVVPAVESVPVAPEITVPSTDESAPKQTDTSLLGAEPPVEAKDPKDGTSTDKPKADDKPVDEKPDVEASKPDGEIKAEPGAENTLPAYEPFVVTEGVGAGLKPDEKVMTEFSALLGSLETAKSDHTTFQEVGQKLVDLYVGRTNEALKAQTDFYVALHEKQKTTDFEALRNDPVIGKSGDAEAFTSYKRDFANFLAANGGTKEEVTQFRQFVEERGVANALPLVRVLHKLKSKIERYETESSKMLTGTKPAVAKAAPGKGIMNALYGNSRNGSAA